MTAQRGDGYSAHSISLNSDMGEAFGLHTFGNDAALMEIIDVANVACGFHSGDPAASGNEWEGGCIRACTAPAP